MTKVLVVFGTRPEAIKMAPVVREIQAHPRLRAAVAVTAQHREMLDQVLEHFRIRPQHDLDIMQSRQSLREVTVRALSGLERALDRERPDVVLVHGDTATTLAGALAAFYARVRVGHVEAGLRSHDKREPFPEEVLRRLTDVVADLHFAPTAGSRANLLAEGIPAEGIFVTGNTAVDALLLTVDAAYRFRHPALARLPLEGETVLAVEVHRRENWGRRMEGIFGVLRQVADERKGVRLAVSVHRNPEVAEVAARYLDDAPRAHLLSPPPGYLDWANLMARCRFVVTDSGGLQEEAPALGKPVLLLRERTERPEAIAAGTVRRVGTDPRAIGEAVRALLDDDDAYRRMATATNPYGDGQAARRTVAALAHACGLAPERPDEWVWSG